MSFARRGGPEMWVRVSELPGARAKLADERACPGRHVHPRRPQCRAMCHAAARQSRDACDASPPLAVTSLYVRLSPVTCEADTHDEGLHSSQPRRKTLCAGEQV